MKSQFQFDKKTGTMVPANDAVAQGLQANVHREVTQTSASETAEKPVFKEEKLSLIHI